VAEHSDGAAFRDDATELAERVVDDLVQGLQRRFAKTFLATGQLRREEPKVRTWV
jgi:hypothetical protein